MGILETIHSPTDLRALDGPRLAQLADEVRAFLVEQTSRTGGHLSPNLGVVELREFTGLLQRGDSATQAP